MTLLLEIALASTALFAAGGAATACLRSASADARRAIWRAVFVGVAVLPLWRVSDASRDAASYVSLASVPAVVTTAANQAASLPWLDMIWAAGCAAVLARLALGLAQVRRWSRTATRGDGADFAAGVTVPMTWGVVRPQILLPESARTWPPAARELVLRHEAAHVRHHDWAWQIFARVVTATLWFHPLAWIADRQLRREAERAADDAVLASGVDAADYADELVNVARTMATGPAAIMAAVGMVERSSLEHRVRHVLNTAAARRPAGWAMRGAIVALVAALSVSVAAVQERPVYKVGDEGVTAPKVIREAKPQYSQDALRNRIEGEVILEAVVTEEGTLDDIRVVKPLETSLDQAAIDAALEWRFEPGRKNGDAVRVRVTLVFQFTVK